MAIPPPPRPRSRLRAALSRFGPPVAWMGVIAAFSSHVFGADQTGSWILPLLGRLLPGVAPAALEAVHVLGRKMGHVVEYGILAILWRRALAPGRRAAAGALLISAAYAALDEVHQSFVPNRGPSGWDVGLDTMSAGLALALWAARGRPLAVLLRLAQWAARGLAAASLAVAVLDWRLGVPAGDLVAAGLALVVVAAGLRRVAGWPRRGRPPPT